MSAWTIVAVVGATAASYFLTMQVYRYALKAQWLDLPNTRSSHVRPTPRGGGISIVVVSLLGVLALATWGAIDWSLAMALTGGGAAVAFIGFLDDRRSTSVRVRMGVHTAAAVWSVFLLGGLAPMQVGEQLVDLGVLGDLLAVIAIIWTLNLFNFMDGIDGIAGSEAAFMGTAGAILAWLGGAPGAVCAAALLIAAASLGFLAWNWPPAKIFMGDVGSGYLGFAVAVVALAQQRHTPEAVFVWLILGGLFFCDATATLVRRVLRGQRASEAHRSHAYQWLSRRWGSHRKVTLTALLVNVIWLLPCAALATFYPRWAGWLVLGALVPITLAVLKVGAGRDS